MTKEKCSICSNIITSNYFDSDKLYQCQKCHTVALSQKLRIKDLDKYYSSNETYSENAFSEVKVNDMIVAAEEYIEIIKKFINPNNKLFLDVGANLGILVKKAKENGFESFGIEKNQNLIISAKKQNINLIEGTPLSFSSEKKFDVITLMHVLEHFENPRSIVKKMHSLLKNGGLFVIEVPNIESYLAKHHKLSWKYIALEHIFYFSPKTLLNLLEREGFEIIYTKKRNHFIKKLSIRHLFYHIFGTPIKLDRFKMKQKNHKKEDPHKLIKFKILRNFIRKILIFFIYILKREDFLFVIAKKK